MDLVSVQWKTVVSFPGCFPAKREETWKTLKREDAFQLGLNVQRQKKSTHLKDKGCWCYWVSFILLMKNVPCAGWHSMLPYPKQSWRCCWGMTLHWKQLHDSSWKIFAEASTDHSSQLASWCFIKITGHYPWLYICPVWLRRFIWHLNFEFWVWGSICIVETFKNSPGVWQESRVLWAFFVAPTLWAVLTVGEHFTAPCSVPVPENILFTSSSRLPHHSQNLSLPVHKRT